MHKVIHLRDNIDRLYMSRKEGFRGLASIEDSISTAIRGIEDNTKKKSKGKLISATRNSTSNMKINRTTLTTN